MRLQVSKPGQPRAKRSSISHSSSRSEIVIVFVLVFFRMQGAKRALNIYSNNVIKSLAPDHVGSSASRIILPDPLPTTNEEVRRDALLTCRQTVPACPVPRRVRRDALITTYRKRLSDRKREAPPNRPGKQIDSRRRDCLWSAYYLAYLA